MRNPCGQHTGAGRCAVCAVRRRAVCAALDDGEIEALQAASRTVHLEAGRIVFHERDPGEQFFTIVDGTVRLSKSLADGRRQILGFPTAGDFLGLGTLGGHSCAAETITPAILCCVPRAAFVALFARLPRLERRLIDVADREIRQARDQILLLGRKTAAERMANFLIGRSEADEEGGALAVRLPMSRHDIADYLGLTPETVSRALTRLAGDGLIAVPRPDRVEIVGYEALAALAGAE